MLASSRDEMRPLPANGKTGLASVETVPHVEPSGFPARPKGYET